MIVYVAIISLFASTDGSFLSFPSVENSERESETNLNTTIANSIKNLHDFANYFGVDLPDETISVRSRSSVIELAQAVCTPEDTTVQLDLPLELGTTFFPSCVRVKRCGGCCILPYHSCQATGKENLRVRVVKVNGGVTTPQRNNRRRVRRQESSYLTVDVEQHKSCICACKLSENECNPETQQYNPSQCTCDCKNFDEIQKCANTLKHFWDSESCKCRCRVVLPCSTGLVFDENSCSCISR